MNENINNQGGATIVTLHPSKVAQAIIYDNEQRAAIVDLIKRGFMPHHTSVGVGNTGRKLWSVEKYKGRFGNGFKMITKSPFSTNFNHLFYYCLTMKTKTRLFITAITTIITVIIFVDPWPINKKQYG